MLEAKNICYRVAQRDLISDLSCTFTPGKLHLMVGPNGAGKSTLIKILARSSRPSSGKVEYEGKDISHESEAALAKRRAVLSQAIEIAFPLAVSEVVMMGRYPHFGGRPGKVDQSIVDELMAYFEVTEFAGRSYQTLSGGERQRVNFARVLAQLAPTKLEETQLPTNCRYLFLDEPLTFLDIHHQISFMKKIRQFSAAPDVVTIGVVHDLNLAARFADNIILLNESRLIAAGAPNQVLTADNIRKVFSVEAQFVPIENSGVHLIFD